MIWCTSLVYVVLSKDRSCFYGLLVSILNIRIDRSSYIAYSGAFNNLVVFGSIIRIISCFNSAQNYRFNRKTMIQKQIILLVSDRFLSISASFSKYIPNTIININISFIPTVPFVQAHMIVAIDQNS